jgi:pyridoxamine 5'-phosphate oxidase
MAGSFSAASVLAVVAQPDVARQGALGAKWQAKEAHSMPDSVTLVTDPFAHFEEWMAEAWTHEPEDANAMTLATATPGGMPTARIVLLKGADARGFVFYTNTQSRKGEELAANARAALLFHWKPQGRQVRIEGRVEPVTEAEADTYYATRPRISRLGAWASDQSRALPDRAELEHRLAEYEAKYPGENIPRPPHWSGYRVVPERFEFWQNMPYRLHDRTIYTKVTGGGWAIGKLYP